MKKRRPTLYFIILYVFCQVGLAVEGVAGPVMAANTENFYFEDFAADYYLTKDSEGISHLKIVENLTAIFPDYQQNKGICREIPMTNQDGANVTLSDLSRVNLILKRNGASEPIYSLDKYRDYYRVCTGNEEYVLGKQVYTFEYEFERVVTDFSDYQELYWDTNGNGWGQRFDSVTARVHLAADIVDEMTGESWCYVGRYGVSDQSRCEITKISDGFIFKAENLARGENLTFDIELKTGAFVVPEPEKNYVLVAAMVVIAIICGLILILPIKKYVKAGEKRRFYKGYFVKPEYQPHPEYSVTEVADVYLGKKEDAKIGVMLDMLVKKQIRLISEDEKRKKWKIKIEKYGEINQEGRNILKILNDGLSAENGEEIVLEKHTATPELARLGRRYEQEIRTKLRKDGLVESSYSKNSGKMSLATLIVYVIFFGWVFGPILIAFPDIIMEIVLGAVPAGIIVGEKCFTIVVAMMIFATIIVALILKNGTRKYADRTMKGLQVARYMDGVKLYIEMAEADRMKMLQSVEEVDVSPAGIVNLYEKLLPYAAVLGLEKSWLAEMEKYYKVVDMVEPEWRTGFSAADMMAAMYLATRVSNQSTGYTASGSGGVSSGGGFSSSFSGGGGGGFSGGGGGGGGGGGR